MKLEDIEEKEAVAESWISKHPGIVLWGVLIVFAIGIVWGVF